MPLGGYVRMLDEREGPVPPEEAARAFQKRPVPARIAVLLAGPGFNFAFALVAFWALFMYGVPGLKPVVGEVTADSTAARALTVRSNRSARRALSVAVVAARAAASPRASVWPVAWVLNA